MSALLSLLSSQQLTPEMIQKLLQGLGAQRVPLEPINPSDLLTKSALQESPLNPLNQRPPISFGPQGANWTPPTQLPKGTGPTFTGANPTMLKGAAPAAEEAAIPAAEAGGSGAISGILSKLLRFGGPAVAAYQAAATPHELGGGTLSGAEVSPEEFDAMTPEARQKLNDLALNGPEVSPGISDPDADLGRMAGLGQGQDFPEADLMQQIVKPKGFGQAPSGQGDYIVQPGDSISKILMARMPHNHDQAFLEHAIASIAKGNNITNPDQIVPGQHLNLKVDYDPNASYKYKGPTQTQRSSNPTQPAPISPSMLLKDPTMGSAGASGLNFGVGQLQHLTRRPLSPTKQTNEEMDPNESEPDSDQDDEMVPEITSRLKKIKMGASKFNPGPYGK